MQQIKTKQTQMYKKMLGQLRMEAERVQSSTSNNLILFVLDGKRGE